MTQRTALAIVCAALVASLLLHLRTIVVASTKPAATATSATARDSQAPEAASLVACTEELARCRTDGFIASPSAIAKRDPSPSAPRSLAEQAATEPPSGEGAQRDALCDIAKQHVREHWVGHEDEIVASLKDIGKTAWVDRWTSDKLATLDAALGLTRSEHDALERAYKLLWADHGSSIRAALDASPPDYGVVAERVRAFWRAEDALIATTIDPNAVEDYRVAELHSRTAILAILGAFAGAPWDESIAW